MSHFAPQPTRPRVAPRPLPTPTVDAEARREADRQRATMELLVELAASQYVDRARVQLRQSGRGVSEDIPCTLSAKGPLDGNAALFATPPREGAWDWAGTFQCMDERAAYEVTFPVKLVFENGRWEIDPGTQKVLSEGGFLKVSVREMKQTERDPAREPGPLLPAGVFPGRPRS